MSEKRDKSNVQGVSVTFQGISGAYLKISEGFKGLSRILELFYGASEVFQQASGAFEGVLRGLKGV